jgi:PAS domain S-box-containing protein
VSGEKVLIVDDNQANAKLVRLLLENEGYEVRTAADAPDAVDALRKFTPRLVLMDIQLPGMDGLELTRRLKADPATAGIVVVALTAYAMKGDEERARAAGCDAYLTKPIDTRTFPATIRRLLQSSGATITGPRSSVLVVEDNPITRKMVRFTLESAGYIVLEAEDGRTALQRLAESPPDIVLQDLALPDMDGLELLTEIRAHSVPGLPVLVLSGRTLKVGELRERGDTFDDFLEKPIEPSRLLAALARHVKSGAIERLSLVGGQRVLVVDDEPFNLKVAEARLHQAGFATVTREGGAEALDLARREPPDAILADVLMPGVDGFQLARAVREDPRLSNVPVVLVSAAYIEGEDRRLAAKMGATALVPRTSDYRQAAAALEAALRKTGGLPPVVYTPEVEQAYHARVMHQLDEQTRANRSNSQRSAIQSATLSVVSGICEALADPLEISQALGTVLVHCLDATGLSSGLLYVLDPDGGVRLSAASGVPPGMGDEPSRVFGRADFLRGLIAEGVPAGFELGTADEDASSLMRGLQQGSILVIPLVALGQPRGALVLGSDSDILSEASWIGFSRTLSAQLGQAVALGQAVGLLAQSEQEYRSLFEGALEGIYRSTMDGRFLSANRAVAEMLGFRSGQELLEGVKDIVGDLYADPADRARMVAAVEKDGYAQVEMRLRRRDGSLIWVRENVRGIRNAEGRIVSLEGMLQDVTARREAEEALRESERRLRHLLTESPVVVYSDACVDGDLVPNWVSPNVESITGYSDAEVLHPSWWLDALHPEEREAVRARTFGILDFDRVLQEYRLRRRDGRWIWIRDESRLVRDAEGRPKEVVGSWIDVTERHEAEDAHRESVVRYQALFYASPIPMWLYDPTDLHFVDVNAAASLQYGWTKEELLSMTLRDVRPPEDLQKFLDTTTTQYVGPKPVGVWRHLRKDGSLIDVEVHVSSVALGGKELRLALLLDVSEKRTLEAEFRQAQKMEAVGRLAGGVAHDFNNLLTVINGYTEMLRDQPDLAHSKRAKLLSEIAKAGERASGLTRQLLAFGRKTVFQPHTLDLNRIVSGVESMLRRLIGEDVVLKSVLDPELHPVKADPGQLEQVLMNLVINSRDAMPKGGTILIETRNVSLEELVAVEHSGAHGVPHVRISVADTGTGMDEATQSHLFEPFFTTKEQGKGTGLGLSTVYGIVHQSDGFVRVRSVLGRGTTFDIYLPRAEKPAGGKPTSAPRLPTPPSGTETILLVEDDDSVRRLAVEILRSNGYTVLEAASPSKALALSESHTGTIHLLLTDVVMPELTGPDLAQRIRGRHPAIRSLFMSGYTADTAFHKEIVEEGTAFVEKPFRPAELARKVRKVLGG